MKIVELGVLSQIQENASQMWVGVAIAAVIFLLLTLLAWYCLYYRGPLFQFCTLKQPASFPRIRNMISFNLLHNDLLPALVRTFDEFKPIVNANIMGLPHVFVTEMEELHGILCKEPDKAGNREVLVPWLGQGPLTDGCTEFTEGPPDEGPYHYMIGDYLEITNKHVVPLVNQIRDRIHTGLVSVTSLIYLCVLDIMIDAGMGVGINAQQGGESSYVTAVLSLSQLIHKRQVLSWLLRPCVFSLTPTGREQNKLLKRIFKFNEKIILQRIKHLEKGTNRENPCEKEKENTCFLDLLIRGEVGLTVKEIQDEVNNFIFANHDKTSASIIWALFELGHNPDIQEQAYLEQRDIFRSSRRAVTADDLVKMTYLDRIIKETFRLYPSTPIISRRLKADVKIRGYDVPAGTDIPIFVYYIHRNPDLYPNPEQFNPDRFLPHKALDLRRESYTPLIFGPRFCFVEEFAITKQKIILSHVLRNFQFQSMDKHEDLELMGEFILRPKNNLKFSFKSRIWR